MNEGKDRRYWNFCDVELTDAFIHGKSSMERPFTGCGPICASHVTWRRERDRATLRFQRWEVAEGNHEGGLIRHCRGPGFRRSCRGLRRTVIGGRSINL